MQNPKAVPNWHFSLGCVVDYLITDMAALHPKGESRGMQPWLKKPSHPKSKVHAYTSALKSVSRQTKDRLRIPQMFAFPSRLHSNFHRNLWRQVRRESNLTLHVEAKPSHGEHLRTRTLVFLGGPFTPARFWAPCMASFALKGFESRAWTPCTIGKKTTNINNLSEQLHSFVSESRAFPPIFISFGLGSQVLLKYLESYPATASIFISPNLSSTHVKPLLSELKMLAPTEMQHVEETNNILEIPFLFPEFLTESPLGKALETEFDGVIEKEGAFLPMDAVESHLIQTPLESSVSSRVPMLVIDVLESQEGNKQLADVLECDYDVIQPHVDSSSSIWTWMLEPISVQVNDCIIQFIDDNGF
jgi:hypothetical protein